MNTSSTSPWSRGASHRNGPFPKRSIEIGAIVVSFIYVWPVAVAYVAWKIAGYPALDQMREFARSGAWSFGSANGQSRFARAFEAAKSSAMGNTGFGRAASGNWAFEEYRSAELERLEARRRALQEESEAFAEFVEELKRAKDREQFDAFMAKRRSEGGGPTVQA